MFLLYFTHILVQQMKVLGEEEKPLHKALSYPCLLRLHFCKSEIIAVGGTFFFPSPFFSLLPPPPK